MWTLVRYVLTAALRDRIVLTMAGAFLVGMSLAMFLGSSAVIEKDKFAAVYAAGGIRFVLVAGVVLFAVSHIRRSFESKDVDLLLTRPVGRVGFLAAHALAFSLMAVVLAVCATLPVGVVMAGKIAGAGFLLWALSLVVEAVIVANAALFFSMILNGVASATMATLALYVLGRMIGPVLGIVDSGVSSLPVLNGAIQVISLIVPRLDLLAQTSWLVYGIGDAREGWVSFAYVTAHGVFFSLLLWLAALIDLVRRQF